MAVGTRTKLQILCVFVMLMLLIFYSAYKPVLIYNKQYFTVYAQPRKENRNTAVINRTENRNTSIIPQTESIKSTIIVYWSTVFGADYGSVSGLDCECIVTSDRRFTNQADAFVVHARDIHMIPPDEYKEKPWILHSQENPVYTPALKDENILSKFNVALTYRLDADVPQPIFSKPNLNSPLPFVNKTGLIISVSSNCEPGRTEYQRLLMQHIQVDSYGACLNNKNDLVQIYGPEFKQQKETLERKYKFSLVFSNQDCDYFVDDRIVHSWNAGTVPIWMGTDKIDNFLVGNLKDSIIKVRDFATPQKLAEYLLFLSKNETAYNKYLDWKSKGIGECSEKTRAVCHFWGTDGSKGYGEGSWCDVCKIIQEGGSRLHNGLKVDDCLPRKLSDWVRE